MSAETLKSWRCGGCLKVSQSGFSRLRLLSFTKLISWAFLKGTFYGWDQKLLIVSSLFPVPFLTLSPSLPYSVVLYSQQICATFLFFCLLLLSPFLPLLHSHPSPHPLSPQWHLKRMTGARRLWSVCGPLHLNKETFKKITQILSSLSLILVYCLKSSKLCYGVHFSPTFNEEKEHLFEFGGSFRMKMCRHFFE